MSNELTLGLAGFPVGAQDAEDLEDKHHEYKLVKADNALIKNQILLSQAYISTDKIKTTENNDFPKETTEAYSLAYINEFGLNLSIQSKSLITALKDYNKSLTFQTFSQLERIVLYLQQLRDLYELKESVFEKYREMMLSIKGVKLRILHLQNTLKEKQLEQKNNTKYFEFEEMLEELREPYKKKLQKVIIMRHITQQLILANPKWMKSKKYVNLLIKLKDYPTWENFEKSQR